MKIIIEPSYYGGWDYYCSQCKQRLHPIEGTRDLLHPIKQKKETFLSFLGFTERKDGERIDCPFAGKAITKPDPMTAEVK